LDPADSLPTEEDDLRRLGQEHAEANNWRGLATVLDRLVLIQEGVEEQVATLVALARVYSERLGETRLAIDALERAVLRDPCEADAWEQLIALWARSCDAAKLEREKARLVAATAPKSSTRLTAAGAERRRTSPSELARVLTRATVVAPRPNKVW
jgi:hypothetical protein